MKEFRSFKFSTFFLNYLLASFLALWLSLPLSQAIAITDVPSGANELPCLEPLTSKNERPNKRRPKQASDPEPTPQGKKNKNKGMETTTTTTTTTKPRDGECRSAIAEVSSAAQGTKNGVEEKKESLRTSGCDKLNVGEEADKGSSTLRSAEDVREVGSRVDIFS